MEDLKDNPKDAYREKAMGKTVLAISASPRKGGNPAKMSTSTFHRHFRSVTSMSPLQYQKSLRLHAARRLMLTDHLDAASAAFKVGYESHTQFSREYSRMFGAPPLRDIKSIRQLTDKSA